MKTLIAIDPGASGGIAYAISGNSQVEAHLMPADDDLKDTLTLLAREPDAVCYMELVGGYIKGNPAPGSAMFNFGNGYGYIRGLLAALRIKLVLVRPQLWQAGIPGRNQEKAARKRALKEHAARLFPNLKVTLNTADALCILNYANNQEAKSVPYVKIHEAKYVQTFGRGTRVSATPSDPHGTKIGNPNNAKFGADVKIGLPVAKVDLPDSQREQAELAIAWCKKNGWKVPPRKSAAFSQMFDYWYNKAINGEA